ncbi:MAG: oligoendopeptidase, pepF/M3 family [Solirubrobacterales bacterium]|nr:oligoendopeptidase, pepF/M3 family [Solirubrobacterales bacterium]
MWAVSETTAAAPADEALESARWDLEPLVEGQGGEGAIALLDEAQSRAEAFAERHRGKVAELDPGALAAAMSELEEIGDRVGRAGTYASLAFSVDTQSPEVGALMQKVRERSAAIETVLLFFELEWNQLDDGAAAELLDSGEAERWRHYLTNLRRYRPHQLSEPEERVLTETEVTGRSAFSRLFAEQTSAITVELGDAEQPLQLMEALSILQGPDREARRGAAAGVTAALEPDLRTRAFVFNTLLADKATKDRLRSYEHWLASRNLANEASDESVAALIEAVVGRYELARRWYRLKARLLGVERLAHYDRMAPVAETEQRIGYAEARELVLDCYRGFSPELGATVEGFFRGDHIDAPPLPGKRGGAFCSYAVPSAHPYVMLNYTSLPGDVLVMAHELGHGVHAALARPKGLFEFATPLTVAETASIFGETIVLGRLLERAPDAGARLALLAESLDGAVAAVFRQVAMNRFEDRVHGERRNTGELSVDGFGSAWLDTQADLLGDSVELTPDYGSWWSYVPHFIDTPGYVYAYAYGHLLALSVYRRYEERGEGFVDSYLELLRAGGSRSPEDLGAIVGVDLTDPGFWDAGLDLIERRLAEAEETAAEAEAESP